MTGYFLLLLPDYGLWQGFYLHPLHATSEFVQNIRTNLPSIPFDRNNLIIPDTRFQDVDLSGDDMGCLTILSSMLIHDALLFDLAGIAVAADGISRILKRQYFWIEGIRQGCCTDRNIVG